MAQHDFVINNQGFPAFRSDLNDFLNAVRTTHSGTSRPTGAVAGTIWLDTTSATNPILKYYDGADDITLATIDHSANTVNFSDSASDLVGDLTPQLGGMLDVNGQSIGDGTLELIKFSETASAVNEITITNSATGNKPKISSTGDDTNIGLILSPKGTGILEVTGSTNSGRIQLNCEQNTHGIKLASPPHSAGQSYTLTFPTTAPSAGKVLQTDGSGNLSFESVSGGISWQSSVKTSGFTAVAGEGYFCNTTSSAFTVTLPASPSAGNQIALVDYAGTFDTNALTISPNGNKIEGATASLQLKGEREGILLVYIDSTQGWLATSGINEGTDALEPIIYSVDFLVIAGGGAGGYDYGGGGGAGGYRTSTQSVNGGTVITVTVGDGGAGGAGTGASGSNSSISGAGLTTITSAGGGGGATPINSGVDGGSGGGGARAGGGAGNTPSTSPSQGNSGGTGNGSPPQYGSAGGGGAGAIGNDGGHSNAGAGGAGTASSITGSSVTRAGGGGGSPYNSGTGASGGTGGGGRGGDSGTYNGEDGTANTGGGGGAGGFYTPRTGKSGGKGVVILSLPTANYSSTTTGSPTVTTSGSNTILQFNGSGSYTA